MALELELVCCLRDLGRIVAGETSRAEPGVGDPGRIEQPLQRQVAKGVGPDVLSDLVDLEGCRDEVLRSDVSMP